ncbi:unnamed protein product [Pleuronectes platessa]|uniref:Fibronectin type-III domain-containing protein n=1 Tax=Pleuronectes platessa TaxID=8262 RepID=A0A9N7UG19_PLEPL|nr:unnamed protein product [Pleuronectes platessa]
MPSPYGSSHRPALSTTAVEPSCYKQRRRNLRALTECFIRGKSDKMPLRGIFSFTEDRRSRGHEHSLSPTVFGALKKDWASPNSIALSWQQPEQTALPILDYEVKYYEKEHEQLSYSSTRTKAPSVIISGLKPATWYVFSVRTRTPAGYSSYSPKYEYESTGDCEYQCYFQPMCPCVCTSANGMFSELQSFALSADQTVLGQAFVPARRFYLREKADLAPVARPPPIRQSVRPPVTSDIASDQGQVLVVVTAAVGGFTLLVILTLFFLITGR